MKSLDFNDIWILVFLKSAEAENEYTARPISNMMKENALPIKRKAYVKRLKKLVEQEYVAEGIKTSKENGYYITKKGIDFFKTITNLEEKC